jgi:hypothetical protein
MRPRTYSESIYDLPRVGIPDWELFTRLEALIFPYFNPIAAALATTCYATDNRGDYSATSIAELRRRAEDEEQPPTKIQISIGDGQRLVNVYTSSLLGSGAQIRSNDEEVVHHLAARIRELFAQAAQRLEPNPPAQEHRPEQVAVPPEPGQSRLLRFLYDPWTIAIGSALIVTGIVGVLVFAF